MKLNQAQKEALKAGKSVEEVLLMADTHSDPAPTPTEVEAVAAAAAAAKKASTLTPEAAMAKIEEMTAAATEASAKLATSEAALATAAQDLVDLKASVETSKTTVEAMAAALGAYVTSMGVGLGQSVDIKGMSAADVLAQHNSMREKFNAAYKTGRQAKSAATDEAQTEAKTFNAGLLAAASSFKL